MNSHFLDNCQIYGRIENVFREMLYHVSPFSFIPTNCKLLSSLSAPFVDDGIGDAWDFTNSRPRKTMIVAELRSYGATALNRILGGERSSRVSLRGDRIAAECRRVHYKMHYLRDTFAIALRPAIFLAGERFYIVRTVVDRKSAYRYHRAALLFPFILFPLVPRQSPPLMFRSLYFFRNEKSRCVISRDKPTRCL